MVASILFLYTAAFCPAINSRSAFVERTANIVNNNVATAVGNNLYLCQSSSAMMTNRGRLLRRFNVNNDASEGDKILDAVVLVKQEGEVVLVESDEERERALGNLVADDEWLGLSMEITELVRVAIVEDLKKNTRDFIGKEDYKFGDISKQIDERVKSEVALFRGKEEYELGDLSMALDTISKQVTCELTGKDEYEFGDLSKEIDSRVKAAIVKFSGKEAGEAYEIGDLSKEIDRRVKNTVAEFTSKDGYEFGDVSRELARRREAWVKDFLGSDDYQFGDLTKKAMSNFTGKDNYEFGDISKKLLDNVFGKRKRGGEDK